VLIPTTVLTNAAGGAGSFSLIQTQALAADAGSVTFSAIPGTYEHLMILWTARGTDAGNPDVYLQFNGDTGANYDRELLVGVSAAPASGATVGQTALQAIGTMPGSTADAGRAAGGTIRIASYARTTFWKTAVGDFSDIRATSAGNQLAGMAGGIWRSTAAITSVTLLPSAGNFLAGSVFSLYGIT
jgi:hypothetical protein